MGSDNQGRRHYSAVKRTRSRHRVFPMVHAALPSLHFKQIIPRNEFVAKIRFPKWRSFKSISLLLALQRVQVSLLALVAV